MKKILFLALATIVLMACGTKNKPTDNTPAEGQLPGIFHVTGSKKICFSQGNLQYCPATNVWRFAPRQYGVVGGKGDGNIAHPTEDGEKSDNCLISQNYDGWIDLFGHGTSGWPSGAEAYQPWTDDDNYEHYIPLSVRENTDLDEYNLVDIWANADWGVYNKISNGGNQAGLWRSLTREEWRFITEERPNHEDLIGKATINGARGMVLLPDDWQIPADVTFEAGYGQDWDTNEYNYDEWLKLEKAGAVFLPCAGCRSKGWAGNDIESLNSAGYYWTSSSTLTGGKTCAFDLYFNSWVYEMYTYDLRSNGESVRLVREIQ